MALAIITKSRALDILAFCRLHNEREFIFAVDQGAYFAATTGSHEDKSFQNCVQFLKGMNPEQDEDWYDTAHGLFGYDDVGEFLSVDWLEMFEKQTKDDDKAEFGIDITTTEVRLVIKRSKA